MISLTPAAACSPLFMVTQRDVTMKAKLDMALSDLTTSHLGMLSQVRIDSNILINPVHDPMIRTSFPCERLNVISCRHAAKYPYSH